MENPRRSGPALGPSGTTAADNVARLRRSRGWSLRDLEREVAAVGHRLSLSALSKIENADRRIDVDDLMALAVALEVSPLAILLPQAEHNFEAVAATTVTTNALRLWEWAVGTRALRDEDARAFEARSLPRWLQILPDVYEWDRAGETFQPLRQVGSDG